MRTIATAFMALTILARAGAAAENWSGVLVDADCYAAMERNVSPKDTLINVDRDRDFEIRYCRPGPKTKSFTLVDHDGQSHKLDASGNVQASEIAQKSKKGSRLYVTVTGQEEQKTIRVDSIVPGH